MTALDASSELAEALAKRHRAEGAVEQRWQDAARRSFRSRYLDPLDQSEARVQAALRELAAELARARADLAR